MTAFGEFQAYYTIDQLSNESQSKIAWIGATQVAILLISGVISGPLFDLGHLRSQLITGSFLMIFGIMMTSICQTLWQFVLAQGICYGLGSGIIFIPMIGVITQWFSQEKRGMANGIASIGSGIGKLRKYLQ